MTSRQLFAVLGLAFVGLSGLASPVRAAGPSPYFFIPASSCHPGKSDVSKIGYTDKYIQNESTTSSAKVYCPVIIDEANTASSGVRGHNISITMIDAHSSQNITCTLYHNTSQGLLAYSETRYSSGVHTSPWGLSFREVSTYGVYSVVCTLPPGPTSTTRSKIYGLHAWSSQY